MVHRLCGVHVMVEAGMFVNIQCGTEFRTYRLCEAHRPHTKNMCTTWYTCYDVHTVRFSLDMLQ